MTSGYFHRVTQQTPTRFWINNPSGEDIERAIAGGAINCTTNPSYGSKLLQSEPAYIRSVIDQAVQEVEDNDQAAERACFIAASRVMDSFLPMYRASGGSQGYVTVQDDPRADDDPDWIVEAALRGQRIAPNFMAKIPVIESGMEAIEQLVARSVPVCATEVFSIAQAVHVCEAYRRAARQSGNHPPFYVTHITGILDQYFAGVVGAEGIDIAPEVLAQAACVIARKEYQILKQRGYEGTLLGGGARGLQHFTEFVGGDVHITVNWSTAEELIQLDGPVVSRIDQPTPKEIVEELAEWLPNFRRAFYEDAMSPAEFGDFGPLTLFKTMFLNGYARLLDEVAERQARL